MSSSPAKVNFYPKTKRKPWIVFTAIVKDEAHVIREALDSCYQRGLINAVAIVDNGSTDNTIQVIRDYCHEKQLPGGVISTNWFQFDGTRNISFQYAEYVYGCICTGQPSKIENFEVRSLYFNELSLQRFGICTRRPVQTDALSENLLEFRKDVQMYEDNPGFIWNMDADDTLYDLPETISLATDYTTVSMTENHMRAVRYIRSNLLRIHPYNAWEWIYRIHETLSIPQHPYKASAYTSQVQDIVVISGRHGSRNKDPAKALRDAIECEIMLREGKGYTKLRYLYYSAQGYHNAGWKEKAHALYKQFIEQPNVLCRCRQEVYISCMVLGHDAEKPMDKIGFYQRAMHTIPERLEAPYYLFKFLESQGLTRMAYESLNNYCSIVVDPRKGHYLMNGEISRHWFYNTMIQTANNLVNTDYCYLPELRKKTILEMIKFCKLMLDYPGQDNATITRVTKNLETYRGMLTA